MKYCFACKDNGQRVKAVYMAKNTGSKKLSAICENHKIDWYLDCDSIPKKEQVFIKIKDNSR